MKKKKNKTKWNVFAGIKNRKLKSIPPNFLFFHVCERMEKLWLFFVEFTWHTFVNQRNVIDLVKGRLELKTHKFLNIF